MIIFDLIILVSSISTYIYFFSIVRSIRRAERIANNPSTSGTKTLIWEKFKVTILMMFTYIVFNTSRTILSTIASFIVSDKDTVILLYDIIY